LRICAALSVTRGRGRPAYDDRRFIEAVLWWRRTGVPWRDLPHELGPWKTVFNRFDRWSESGRWSQLLAALQSDPDDEWHSLDSTINRAHQHAAGGKGGASAQAIGRSRGGLSTKVHLVVDALGLPLVFEITEGQRHDSQPASELAARASSRCLLADKAYDSGKFRQALAQHGCLAVIPSNASRALKLPYDRDLYKARSEIERTINLLKQARRFATRYEKTLRNYAAVVAIGCALLWLRI
jgi:transposase